MTHTSRTFPLAATFALTLGTALQAGAYDAEMSFSAGMDHTGRTLIFAEGVFTEETADAFVDFVRAIDAPSGSVVVLHSPGGNAIAGFDLGFAIRDFGFETTVGRRSVQAEPTLGQILKMSQTVTGFTGVESGECYSSCALAFLGGTARRIETASVYGVHQFSIDCADATQDPDDALCRSPQTAYAVSQSVGAATVGFFVEMGASPELYIEMASTAPDDMTVLSPEDLLRLNVVTR